MRITDLTTIRDTHRAALDAGCDDLVACSDNDCCPIPFAAIPTRPHRGTTLGRSEA
ncbi:hypothetical protein ACI78V_17915 [Geodermatophilus sp. SYSU D00742]